jgi:hypothetical protein
LKDNLDEEMSIAELNMLLKFLGAMGELPKIELGEGAIRGERFGFWRAAVEAQLKTTRKVVTLWWEWCFGKPKDIIIIG